MTSIFTYELVDDITSDLITHVVESNAIPENEVVELTLINGLKILISRKGDSYKWEQSPSKVLYRKNKDGSVILADLSDIEMPAPDYMAITREIVQ